MIPLLDICPKDMKTLMQIDICTLSIIYNSKHMKTTWISVDGWMDKEDMAYMHTHTHIPTNGILLSHVKEGNLIICDNKFGP